MNASVLPLLGAWAALRAQEQLFWAFHWRAKGVGAYADHILFERLKNDREKEIDRLAEILMVVGGPAAVDPLKSWLGVTDCIEKFGNMDGTDISRSIALVADTLNRLTVANDELADSDYGLSLNNALGGIADKQLEALFLLKQRNGG